MTQILILGAGMSSSSLITYLLNKSEAKNWHLLVCDQSLDLAKKKVANHPRGEAISFDIFDEGERHAVISKADVVVSMLPASFHIIVAKSCLQYGKHMLTASYITEELGALEAEFKAKGLLFLGELGLDPGIDHMSAMKVIDHIRTQGHELTGFETFTGGLLSEASEEGNPWQYKFTWNPRNVVLAGQGIVKFRQEGRYKYIPYHKLFRRTEIIHIPGHGYFEGYANRDSLKYLSLYHLQGIPTLYRGTLRRPGFCKAWNIFVQLGATDDTYQMENVAEMTHRQFLNSFLSFNPQDSVELKLAHYLGLDIDGEEMFKLQWLGLFEETLVGLQKGSPAQILEHILRKKWTMTEEENDRIVMWHKFDFIDNGVHRQIQSHMVAVGENVTDTAMAKTVGLPLAIATCLVAEGKVDLEPGMHIPTVAPLYEPILEELAKLGFEFEEREIHMESV